MRIRMFRFKLLIFVTLCGSLAFESSLYSVNRVFIITDSAENEDVTVVDIEDDSAFAIRKNDGKKHVHFSEETITVMIPNPPKGFCDSVKKLLDFVCCCGCCFPNYL